LLGLGLGLGLLTLALALAHALRCRMRQLCTEALRSWYAAAQSPHRRRTVARTDPDTNLTPAVTITRTGAPP